MVRAASIILALLLSGVSVARAQVTRYVSPAGSHTYPYTNWARAATNLQAALTNIAPGSTVLVTNGTYFQSSHIRVTNAVTIRSVNGPAVTTLDGRGSNRVMISVGSAAISGFTIRNGLASGTGTNAYGGGLYGASVRVSNCIFRSCVATDRGGGIYLYAGTGLVTHCEFYNNDSPYGGAIHLRAVGSVSNCQFRGNRAIGSAGTGGGGVYIYQTGSVYNSWFDGNTAGNDGGGVLMDSGGFVSDCFFEDNVAGDWGGGVAVYFATGITRDSVMIGNRADEGGGAYLHQAGLLQNCTIVGNSASLDGGGVKLSGGGTSINSIVYFNSSDNASVLGTGGGFRDSCVTPLPSGSADFGGNIDADPQLLLLSERAVYLAAGSPCIDAGTNDTWMTGATDLRGVPRIIGSSVDIGAYEFGPLVAAFTASPRSGQPPLPVSFDAYVSGTNMGSLYYRWDPQNDGTFDVSGAAYASYTHTFTNPGLYSVRLVVTNGIGEQASTVRSSLVSVAYARYVATNGSHTAPFITWATAATNLQAAVDASDPYGLIFVSNGVYAAGEVIVTQTVTIASMNGPSLTTLASTGSTRVIRLGPDTSLAGFTIRNGFAAGTGENGYGGGVLLDRGGSISNCIIVSNRAALVGGGVCMLYGGTILNSVIRTNVAPLGGGFAAYQGGLVYDTVVSTNTATDRGGGGYILGAGLSRGCIIHQNVALTNGGGVAFNSSGGTLQNGTVVSNTAARGGGVACEDGGNVQNSIVYFNAATAGFTNWFTNTLTFNYGAVFQNVCLTPTNSLPSATGCLSNNPAFISTNGTPYYLSSLSPCVNRATYQLWMNGAFDLLGAPRVVGGSPDIGALERLFLALAITNSTSGLRLPFSATRMTVSGTMDGLTGILYYTNSFPGGQVTGTVSSATNWSFQVRLPTPGWQTISITGTDTFGNVAVDSVTIRRNKNQVFIFPAP